MKFDISEISVGTQRYGERLNCTVQVHVKKRIVVMPDSSRRVGHFVTDKPEPIVARIRLLLRDRCASPSHNGRLHPHCGTDRCKIEIRGAADRELTIGKIVKHVALVRMRLTPGVFVRADVSGFAKIGRTRILCWVQVAALHPDAVRDAVVLMAAVIVGVRWKGSGERIDPGARTDAVSVAIQA